MLKNFKWAFWVWFYLLQGDYVFYKTHDLSQEVAFSLYILKITDQTKASIMFKLTSKNKTKSAFSAE